MTASKFLPFDTINASIDGAAKGGKSDVRVNIRGPSFVFQFAPWEAKVLTNSSLTTHPDRTAQPQQPQAEIYPPSADTGSPWEKQRDQQCNHHTREASQTEEPA